MSQYGYREVTVGRRYCPYCHEPIFEWEWEIGDGDCPGCGRQSDSRVRYFEVTLCLHRSFGDIAPDDPDYMIGCGGRMLHEQGKNEPGKNN